MTGVPLAADAYALLALPGMGPGRLRQVLDRWPEPDEAVAKVRAGRAALALEGEAPREARRLAAAWARAVDPEAAAAALASRGTRVFLERDDDYPIAPPVPDGPPVLLAEGDRADVIGQPRVAVVGTRAATPHGLADARELGAALAESGVVVVSGMAVGIDGAAHEGALEAGGGAVGVLATGLDVVYPRRHELLFRRVRKAGLLVSEVAFGIQPERWRFPVRNRIIAALADVVVVVEATAHGGARITAEHALAYARPVFAVPGSRRNPAAAGCNTLIADGAHPLLDPSDVLLGLGMTPAARRAQTTRTPPPVAGPSALVHRALGGEPATADQLASRTGLSPAEIAVALMDLERSGWAETSRGMVWPR